MILVWGGDNFHWFGKMEDVDFVAEKRFEITERGIQIFDVGQGIDELLWGTVDVGVVIS